MARFSVYPNPDGPGYLLDVQANLLSHLNTRVVVPLLPKTLNPTININGAAHVMVTQFMAAVPQRLLQTQVLSLEDRAHELVAALDCLFQGV